MSDDRPIVAPEPRRNADGTTTVTTLDAGDIRLVCPDWCVFSHVYRHPPAKNEIAHHGEQVWALADTPEYGPTSLVEVSLIQWPYSDRHHVLVTVETDDGHIETGSTGARRIATALRRQAGHIDRMADTVEAIRAGESQ